MGSRKLKKLKQKFEKGAKKLGKGAEKVLKESAVPVAIALGTATLLVTAQNQTDNKYSSQGASILVDTGKDNLSHKLENMENKAKIQETVSKNNLKETETFEDANSRSKSNQSTSNLNTNDQNSGSKLFKSDNNLNTSDLNFGSKSHDNWKTTIQPSSSLDKNNTTLRIKTTLKNGDNSVSTSLTNDFKNVKVSSAQEINNNLSVGQTVSINNKDVRFGLSSKTNGNKYTESGIGYETGKSEREVFGYTINRTNIKTDSKGGCVSKQTYKRDYVIPFCGKVGSHSQDTLVCPDSITTTDKFSVNSNAAVCGMSVVPVGKVLTTSGKAMIGAGKAIKQTGMVLGTVTMINGELVASN